MGLQSASKDSGEEDLQHSLLPFLDPSKAGHFFVACTFPLSAFLCLKRLPETCFLFDPNFIHRKLKFPTCNKFDGIGKNPVFGKTSKAKGRKGNIVKKLNEKAMFLKKL